MVRPAQYAGPPQPDQRRPLTRYVRCGNFRQARLVAGRPGNAGVPPAFLFPGAPPPCGRDARVPRDVPHKRRRGVKSAQKSLEPTPSRGTTPSPWGTKISRLSLYFFYINILRTDHMPSSAVPPARRTPPGAGGAWGKAPVRAERPRRKTPELSRRSPERSREACSTKRAQASGRPVLHSGEVTGHRSRNDGIGRVRSGGAAQVGER